MRPLPWDRELKFPPEEYYIELDLDIYDRTGKFIRRESAEVEEMFDPTVEGGNPAARVLVRGDAGFGKTTLCAKLVHDWSHNKTTFRNKPCTSTLPVLYKLRYLEREQDLEDVLFSLFRSVYNEDVATGELRSILKGLRRNLLIILDGFDEERQKEVTRFVSWENNTSLFKEASFLVTSRPTTDPDFLNLFEKHFKIRNISEHKMERMVISFDKYWQDSFTPQGSKTGKGSEENAPFPETRRIEKIIRERSGAHLEMKVLPPLMVSLICWMVRQRDFAHGDEDIIYNCMLLLCRRCNVREGFGFSEQQIKDILWLLGAMVRVNDIHTNIFISELKKCFEENQITFLTFTGILKKAYYELSWEPVHKSFFDTLARSVSDRTMQCSPERTPLQFFENIWQMANEKTIYFCIGAGELQRLRKVIGRDFVQTLNYESRVTTLQFSNSEALVNTDNSIVIEIKLRLYDIPVMNAKSAFCNCSKFLEITFRYRIFFQLTYVLADDQEETLETMFCLSPKSVLCMYLAHSFSSVISISAADGFNIRRACCYVLDKLFQVSAENSTTTENQYTYLENAMYSLMKRERKVSITKSCQRHGYEEEIRYDFPATVPPEEIAEDRITRIQDATYTWDDLKWIEFALVKGDEEGYVNCS